MEPAGRRPPVIRCNNRPFYSMRAERGNAISKENPSFVAGVAGGCGSVNFPMGCPLVRADFVLSRMATVVTVGGCQARRVPRTVVRDIFGRMSASGSTQAFYGIGSGMAIPALDRAGSRNRARRRFRRAAKALQRPTLGSATPS
jgi:hypothetical protein